MVIFLMLIWSLVAVSIVRFLYNKGLKWAALAYGALYISLTIWAYFLFAMDAAHLGFAYDKMSTWDSGVIYDSFLQVNHQMMAVSSDWLIAMVFACLSLAISVVVYLAVSGVRLVRHLYKSLSHVPKMAWVRTFYLRIERLALPDRHLYLTFCRLIN